MSKKKCSAWCRAMRKEYSCKDYGCEHHAPDCPNG